MAAATTRRSRPVAVLMAFGTKGDVYPIAPIAAAFASDQMQYDVFFITHSAHENISKHLAAKEVTFLSVSSPPVLSPWEGFMNASFSLEKKEVTRRHRQECVFLLEEIFGDFPSLEGDFIVINFFALEGWSLAELFNVRCVVAAPYVVPYSAPSSFERQFSTELPLLYHYLQEAPIGQISWKDVTHWMWPLFTEDWGSWRSVDLKLSTWPFTDPVTDLPAWHDMPSSPLLLYGFSKEVVECPGYWPSSVRVCGFWFLPTEWQFSCNDCAEISALISSENVNISNQLCTVHAELQYFLEVSSSDQPVFIGFSSIGSMGFLQKPAVFLRVLRTVLDITNYRFVLFSAGFETLDAAIKVVAAEESSCLEQRKFLTDGVSLFDGRLFCFSGSIPYNWLFQRCLAAVHHGGSGSTAAALQAGIPQVLCPFMLDQFYWAERMFWLGVSPEPLKSSQLFPDEDEESIKEAANMLARAVNCALSPEMKARSSGVAERLSFEDGVLEAVKNLKDELRI